MRRREIPPWPIISPAMMKKGMARRLKERTPWTICWTTAIRGMLEVYGGYHGGHGQGEGDGHLQQQQDTEGSQEQSDGE